MSKAKIELREYSLVYTSHQYWARYNEAGQLAGELHGMAIDSTTQEPLIVGSMQDKLRVFIYPSGEGPDFIKTEEESQGFSGLYNNKQRAVIMLEGEEEIIEARWNAALKAASVINERDINYAMAGKLIDFSDISIENVWTKIVNTNDSDLNIGNNNSIARTLGDIMGFPSINIRGRALPGQEKNLLPQEQYPNLYEEWPALEGVYEIGISGEVGGLDDPILECTTS